MADPVTFPDGSASGRVGPDAQAPRPLPWLDEDEIPSARLVDPRLARRTMVGTSLGFVVVMVSFVMGRAGLDGATVVFWSGQVLAYASALILLVSPHVPDGFRVGIVTLVAVGQSAMSFAYRPVVFKFPDELQHWRTAEDLLITQKLLTPSPTLPVSPQFPALEVVTTFLVQTLHLPLFLAGVIVVSVCHVVLVLCVYSFYEMVTESGLVSGMAAMLFSTTPHSFTFNTLFVYGAFALPFFVMALRYALSDDGLSDDGLGIAWRYVLGSVACVGVSVVSHPLTAVISIGFLGLLVPALALVRAPARLVGQCLFSALGGALLAAAWVTLVAKDAMLYLGPPILDVLSGLLSFGGASPDAPAAPPPQTSLAERAIAISSILMVGLLICLGLWHVLRWRRPVASALSLTALLYFGVLAVRVLDPRGAEMATRGLTYVVLFSGIPVAVGLLYLCGPRLGWGLPVTIWMLLVAGGLVSGWPASWERLPGTVYIAGFESGVDAGNLELSRWARTAIGTDRRVACDLMTCSLVGGYSRQLPVEDAGAVYYAPEITPEVVEQVAVLNVHFLVVNRLMSEQLPITGRYFGRDPLADRHERPVDPAVLTKFAADPRIALIYDDGQYQVYDLRGLWNG